MSARQVAPLPVGLASENIRIMKVIGDSMEPTLRPFDRVVVDLSDRDPSPPGLFVLFDGLGLVIKRVEVVAGFDPMRVLISPNNPRYTAYESPLDSAGIEGRVPREMAMGLGLKIA